MMGREENEEWYLEFFKFLKFLFSFFLFFPLCAQPPIIKSENDRNVHTAHLRQTDI